MALLSFTVYPQNTLFVGSGSLEVEPIPEMLPVFLKLDELQDTEQHQNYWEERAGKRKNRVKYSSAL